MTNRFLILLGLIFIMAGCSKIATITDSITNASARDIYKRETKQHPLFQSWHAAYTASQTDSVQINLPYFEKGTYLPLETVAYSYTINLKEGEVLTANVHRDSTQQRIFIDLFETTATGIRHIASQRPDQINFELPVNVNGNYKLIIQPELKASTNFVLTIGKKPLYGFPVVGKANDAIQSFWGFERDGGKRKHEGVDIFAPRGTAVVAVADGIVTSSGEKGIGGKQVWMRTANLGSAIYYAHLDSVMQKAGTRVRKGDTLGLVGNTGNAKGGPPHLHFGIYRGGAVDPLPFIHIVEKSEKPQLSSFSKSFDSKFLQVKNSTANLRQSPSTSGAMIGSLSKDQIVTYLGEHRDWIHIKTDKGQIAFIHKSLISAAKQL